VAGPLSAQRARVPSLLLAAYGAPATAFAILLLPPYVFLPAFYTQTLGLPLDWIGYIIVMSRLFDAVTEGTVRAAQALDCGRDATCARVRRSSVRTAG
jgi:hypothetical protein